MSQSSPEPDVTKGLLHTVGRAVRRGAETVVVSMLVVVGTLLILAGMVLPLVAVVIFCCAWVLDVPGGRPFFFTAFGGLCIGVYMFVASVLAGSLARRPSRAVARLPLQRVGDAQAQVGSWIAVEGTLVDGRVLPAEVHPTSEEPAEDAFTPVAQALGPTAPTEGAPQPAAHDDRVGFPLVLRDGEGSLLRIEHWDGTPTPPKLSETGAWTGPRHHLGIAMFVMGKLQRVEHAGGYRGAAIQLRLCHGTAPNCRVPGFLVHSGTRADFVRALEEDETSSVWALASLAALALGAMSVWLAQP